MKIGLITIHNANNYGAILQTFALQKILCTYGKVEVIDYNNKHISISLDLLRMKFSLHGLLGIGKDIFRLYPRKKVIKKFKQFSSKYINVTEEFDSNSIQSNKKLNNYDVYIAGSDQIWNPTCISENCRIDDIYFLSFAPKNTKKISYASSIGNHIYSESEKEQVINLLNDFHAISVREKDGKTQLENILNQEIKHVLDPTLLLSKEEWINTLDIKENTTHKEKYILVYSVPKSPLIRSAVGYYSKKLALKVISIDQGLSPGATVDEHIRDAGPLDYLELFLNAEFIITDSFHGTCFSVNFEKQFISVSPGVHSNRIESFLFLIGLENRIVKSEEDFDSVNKLIDFEKINMNLRSERDKSLYYLNKALKG